jgi:hypothetical protein
MAYQPQALKVTERTGPRVRASIAEWQRDRIEREQREAGRRETRKEEQAKLEEILKGLKADFDREEDRAKYGKDAAGNKLSAEERRAARIKAEELMKRIKVLQQRRRN